MLGTSPGDGLDPLTPAEINAARELIERSQSTQCAGSCLISYLALRESPKQDYRRGSPSAQPMRQAAAIVTRLDNGATFEAELDLTRRVLVLWRQVKQGQPALSSVDFSGATEPLESDPRWIAALRRRHITDLSTVLPTVLMSTDVAPDHHRRVRVIAFLQSSRSNSFAVPIEGLGALVDLTARRVISVVDVGSEMTGNPAVAALGGKNAIAQSLVSAAATSGGIHPTFLVRGHSVEWNRWRFRFGFNEREGVVLYAVGEMRKGVFHSILARASLSEMFVPYASPDSTWYFRTGFDVGEYMMGRTVDSLIAGADVPHQALLLPVFVPEEDGSPQPVQNAVAIYERDGGVLERHGTFARRGTELVLKSSYTVGNYDYGINWIFSEDGSLRVDIELSGVMFVQGTHVRHLSLANEIGKSYYGRLVDDHLIGVDHQHFFAFRLDFDVDGERNLVIERNSRARPMGVGNAHGNAFVTTETLLNGPAKAARDANPRTDRTWVVINPSVRNALGQPEGFALIPETYAFPYLDSTTVVGRIAGFAYHQLWVTDYKPEELYAAGTFPAQGDPSDRLPYWARKSQLSVARDIVVWYTVGVTHLPRPEDWPIMPTMHAGFLMRPAGFDW